MNNLKLIKRIKSAYDAFKDPYMNDEARGLQSITRQLCRSNDIAILEGQWFGDYQTFKVSSLPPLTQLKIKNILLEG
jgi:hypothetical protein